MPRVNHEFTRDEINDRGFTWFVKFVDTYGADVSVVQSSSAERDALWIFIEGGGISNNKGSSHLSIEQAKEVRDAINRWLKMIGA